MTFYVYILQSQVNNTFYKGSTDDQSHLTGASAFPNQNPDEALPGQDFCLIPFWPQSTHGLR